jgi:putative copper resistance protein D
MAVVSVSLLVGAGMAMAWVFVGGWSAIYATSYGVMLTAKFILLGMLLLLGGSNFLLLRQKPWTPAARWLQMRQSVEVEIAIAIVAVLTAASLTSQPPSVDLVQGACPHARSSSVLHRGVPV